MIPPFLATTIGKVIAGLVLVIIILGTLYYCSGQRARQQAAQSKVDRSQAGAARESAEDALNTEGAVNERDRSSEDLTRTNERNIRDADGASDAVKPGARDAGLASLCRRPAYRNHERCRVRQPDPS